MTEQCASMDPAWVALGAMGAFVAVILIIAVGVAIEQRNARR